MLLEGCGIIAQLIQEDAKSPNIRFLVEWLFSVDINHFRASILQSRMLLHILIHEAALDHRSRGRARRRGRAKVAQLEALGAGAARNEDILNLDVAVQQRRLEVVHTSDSLCDISKDVENLGFRQAVLQACVHKVNETPAVAVLHEQEDLVAAAAHLRGVGINVGDNRPVALEALHRLDLGAHASQRLLVRYGDTFQHGGIGAVDGAGQLDEVDVREATLGEVFLYNYSVATDLDLGPRRKRARGGNDARRRDGLAMAGRVGGMTLLRLVMVLHLPTVRRHDAADIKPPAQQPLSL